jgi:hypothetical protein
VPMFPHLLRPVLQAYDHPSSSYNCGGTSRNESEEHLTAFAFLCSRAFGDVGSRQRRNSTLSRNERRNPVRTSIFNGLESEWIEDDAGNVNQYSGAQDDPANWTHRDSYPAAQSPQSHRVCPHTCTPLFAPLFVHGRIDRAQGWGCCHSRWR